MQLENRVRELEGINLITLRLREGDALAVAGKQAGVAYGKAVRSNPKHSLGPPHVHIWAAVMDKIVEADVSKMDEGIVARVLALRALKVLMNKQDIEGVANWVSSFRVSPMYAGKGEDKHMRMTYHLKGKAGLPMGDVKQKLTDLAKAEQEGEQGMTVAHNMATQWVELIDGLPVGNGKVKRVDVQAVFTAVACSLGATRYVGKAPRGGAAYKLMKLAPSNGGGE